VAYEGGFVPYEYTLGSTPFWSLFGDGTLIVPGPQIEIYPGPALPNLTATPVSEDGIQAILEAAREAGLMDGDANYGDQCIADAATTVFTTNADGTTTVVSAYALDVGEPAGTCGNDRDAEARGKLAADRDARVRPPLPGRRGAAAGSDRVAARAPAGRVRRGRPGRPGGHALRGGHG
jgi:ribosomal protein L18